MFSKYVCVDDVPLHYCHTGPSTLPDVPPALDRGELVLCAHGAGWTARTWRRQLVDLEPQHSGVAFDFPGHGRSGSLQGLPDLDAHVRCLAGFASAVLRRPAVCAGHGFGGAVAAAYAATHSDRVRGLVLVATPRRFAIDRAMLETWRAVTMGRATQPFAPALFSPSTSGAVMRECFIEQVQTDPRVRYTDLLAADRCDLTDVLASLSVPTLVLAGADDQLIPLREVEALCRGIRGAELVVIEAAGHMLLSEQPDAVARALIGFVGNLQ